MGARFYDAFHDRMHELTEGACSDAVATDSSSTARRCYLVDTAGYAIWSPHFAALDIYDTRSFQSVPLARTEGKVFSALEALGVFVRHSEILYQGTCTKTPSYLMDSVTADGAFPPAEEADAHYPGSPSLGYFPPWANTHGCVQDVVYYDLDEDALAAQADGVASGYISGAGCYEAASWHFARAPGTNAYLLVIDDIEVATTPESATSFEFACSVENGLYTPGAYLLVNGSCGILHEVPEHPITCPAKTDYRPTVPECEDDGAARAAASTAAALLALLLVMARG